VADIIPRMNLIIAKRIIITLGILMCPTLQWLWKYTDQIEK
jgi:hypothetical protein